MGAIARTYSRATRDVLALLGRQIRLARKQRGMSEMELAGRAGIARSTLQLIEKGAPTVEVGLVIEAAVLVGIPLFDPEPSELGARAAVLDEKLVLLPRATRRPTRVKDDF